MTSDRTRTSAFAVEALWITGSLRQAAKDRAVDDADCGVLAHLYSVPLAEIAFQACSFNRAVIARSTTSEVRSSRPTNRVPIATPGPPRMCRTGWPQLFEGGTSCARGRITTTVG